MNVGFNNPYTRKFSSNKIAFKSNSGFLQEIEVLKRSISNRTPSTESLGRLQAQAQDARLTPEFLKQVKNAAEGSEKLHNLLKELLGLIEIKK